MVVDGNGIVDQKRKQSYTNSLGTKTVMLYLTEATKVYGLLSMCCGETKRHFRNDTENSDKSLARFFNPGKLSGCFSYSHPIQDHYLLTKVTRR